jgi:hypothetical protein
MGFSLTLDKERLIRKENYMYTIEAQEESSDGEINLSEIDLLKKYLNAVDKIKLYIFMKRIEKKLVISRFKCVSGEDNVLVELERKDEPKYSLKIFGEDSIYNVPENAVMFENFLPNYRLFDLKYPKWKAEKVLFLYELFYSVNIYLKDVARGIQYIGPFREAPQRYYRKEEEIPSFVGIKGEAAPAILAADYKNNKKLISDISQWLSEYLNVQMSIDDTEGNFSIIIKDIENDGVENNLMDVGYGLAQLIPILVEVFYQKSLKGEVNQTITLVEQPELHLHPAAQAALSDLFLSASDKNRKYIVETHSENLILRLRRRIVEDPSIKGKVALYYIEKQKEGNSKVVELDIDEKGDIKNWPKGLLSEDFYELLEIKKASKKDKNDTDRGEFTW